MKILLLSLALILNVSWAQTKKSTDAQAAYDDIKKTLGIVPTFLKSFPEESISGAWQDMKGIQFNKDSAIPPKYKSLMGIAVAAQIPCAYCVHLHTQGAKLNNATDKEIKEALAVAASVRRWNAYMSGISLDLNKFREETDRIFTHVANQANRQAMEERQAKVEPIDTPEKAYQDIEMTFGFVPEFLRAYPRNGIVGVWKEMKDLDLNNKTAIPAKYKDLIGLAVAGAAPCPYCSYFHTKALETAGASQDEIKEAVAVSGIIRHWSTVVNGIDQDARSFKGEVEQIMSHLRKSKKEVTVR